MNILRFVIFFLMGVLPSNIIVGQSYDYTKREIIVNTPDSLVKTSIWNKNDKRKIDTDFTYYWYYAGAINHNVGGYSGKLLHGIYEVFDGQQRLKTQGTFNYGIMKGIWYRWHPNGNIYFLGYYKNGLLQGKAKYYAPDGRIISILRYQKGKLNGKSYFFTNDTTITKKYKDNVDVIKVKKITQKIKDKNIDNNNNKAAKSVKSDPQQNQLKPDENKRKWWRISFKKKEKGEIKDVKNKTSLNENKNDKKVSSPQKPIASEKTDKKEWWRFSFLKKKSGTQTTNKKTEQKAGQ